MIIRRPSGLKYPPAIKKERQELIYDWLREFRFSTLEILAGVIDTKPRNCERLFKELRDAGWLKLFTNEHTGPGLPLLTLGPKAQAWGETWGLDVTGARCRLDSISRTAHVLHDLYVQKALLNEIAKGLYSEVFREHAITQDFRSDAFLVMKSGHKIALEFERWQKNELATFRVFGAHAKSILAKGHAGSIFYFRSETDLRAYKERFDCDVWPEFIAQKGGKFIKDPHKTFQPSKIEGLRNCFQWKNLETLPALDPSADSTHNTA